MTLRRHSERASRRLPSAALMAACAIVAGCASATIEDAVPTSAPTASAGAQPFAAPGEYPNLNIIPTPAAEQITPEERAAETAALREHRQALQAQTPGAAADGRDALRRLGQRHADDALEAIGGE